MIHFSIISRRLAWTGRTAWPSRRASVWRLVLLLWVISLPELKSQTPQELQALGPRIRIEAASEITRMDRRTGLLVSEAAIKLTNVGDRPIRPPFVVVVELEAPLGLASIQVLGARGNVGTEPWKWPWLDQSGAIGPSLASGGTVEFKLVLARPGGVTPLYRLVPYGLYNRDPLAVIESSPVVVVNQTVDFDGSNSVDPDGDPLTYHWEFGDGTAAAGPQARHAFTRTGLFHVSLAVVDPEGAHDRKIIPIMVAPEGVYALARTRVLAGDGQPLEGVVIEQTNSSETSALSPTTEDGYVSLGGSPGNYTWRFSKPGYLTVWRVSTLNDGRLSFVPSPWLTMLAEETVALTPLFERHLRAGEGALFVRVPEGAASEAGSGRLTPLGFQGLPLPLPAGWSPVAAAHLDLDQVELIEPAELTIHLENSVRSDAPRVFARFDESSLQWMVEGIVSGEMPWRFPLRRGGAYVVVLPDASPAAPPSATLGNPLSPPALETPSLSELRAEARVEPNPSAASEHPAEVTADVTLSFKAPAELHSGIFFRADIEETFTLRDGRQVAGMPYDTSFFAYQNTAKNSGNGLLAQFPIRPSMALGADVLAEAVMHARIHAPDTFAAAIFNVAGGSASLPGFRLDAGAGAFSQPGILELRILDLAGVESLPGELTVVRAFDLNLSGLASGQELMPFFMGLEPGVDFMLGRVVRTGRVSGIEPVLRLRSDGDGQAATSEPAAGARLSGINGGGRYVLIRLNTPLGLVAGIGRNASEEPSGGLLARIQGQPWLAVTRDGGVFRLLAPPGEGLVMLADQSEEDSGEAPFSLANDAAVASVDLALSGAGLHVLAVTPENGAERVPAVSPVRLRFNKRLDPASFGPDAVFLVGADNQPVPASLSLNLAGDTAELLPVVPLAPSSAYAILLAETLRDRAGGTLVGEREFNFRTAAPAIRAPAGLTIYEPGATGIPPETLDRLAGYAPGEDTLIVVAEGGPGTADPRAPVILVNIDTGETATVLSGEDGSFAGFLRAHEDHYIQAVFLNANGTRVAVDATRQKFDDGSVGLFPGGGFLGLETDDGKIEVEVGPGAVHERAIFKLVPLTLAQALDAVEGTEPEGGKIVAAMRIEMRGRLSEAGSAVSFPFDPSTLEIPPGETAENGAFALCLVDQIDGHFVYRVVDKLRYENGRLIRSSYAGWIAALAFNHPATRATLLFGVHLGFGPHTITGKTFICDDSFESCLESGRVLPGAIVRAFAQAAIRGPGGVPPGAVFSSTGADGRYALVVSGNPNQYSVAASHPRFQQGRILQSNLAVEPLVSRWDFGFSQSAQIANPPSLVVTHRPVFPSPGEPVVVEVRATSPEGGAPETKVTGIRARSLAPAVPAGPQDVEIEELEEARSTGPGFAQQSWRVSSSKAVQVTLDFVSVENRSVRREHIISFSGPPPPGHDNPAPSDPGDRQGPQVIASFPASGEFVTPGQSIELFFNEAIDREVLNHAALIRLYAQFEVRAAATAAPLPGHPILELSADQRRLSVRFPRMAAGRRYTLVVPSMAVRDLQGNALDQDAATAQPEPFTAFLTAAPQETTSLPGVQMGGGALIQGSVLFVLERGGNGALLAYDISDPATPELFHEANLPSPPRSALLIPSYSFHLKTGNRLPVKRDLLVVAGGRVGPSWTGDQLNRGQAYLRVYDVTGPDIGAGPIEEPRFMNLLAGAVINQLDSVVPKLIWSAPNLYYLEHWSEVNSEGAALNGQQIGVINLPEFISAMNVPRSEQEIFPLLRSPGIDLNGDGDYADPGEVAPTPSRLPDGFYGKVASFDLNDFGEHPAFLTDQRILDFDLRGGFLAVTVERGHKRDPLGGPGRESLAAGYRSLALGGRQLAQRDALLPLEGALPKRLVLLPAAAYRIPPDLRGPAEPEIQTLALAIVSLSPDASGNHALAMIDVTDPARPRMLRILPFPDNFPDENGAGFLQSLFLRDDGLLELATTLHRVLVDPRHLPQPPPEDPEILHPAFIGLFAKTGGGSFMDASSSTGVRAVVGLGEAQLYLDPPRLRFVGFPDQPAVVDPQSYAGDENALARLFRGMTEPGFLTPARVRSEGFVESTLNPASPLVHYHLLLEAPGGSGPLVWLGLETLNDHGQPLPPGGLGFPPFRAAGPEALRDMGLGEQDCGVPIEPVFAYRLSDDPLSPWFDRYLSVPLAFIYERLQPEEWIELRSQMNRLIFGSGTFVRAFIDPVMEDKPALAPFAAVADTRRKRFVPVTGATVRALPALYTMGPNPPPAMGHAEMPGTAGNVAAHSGEFRHTTVDLELPSRRLPIVFQRTVGGQDLYHGPFGRGWDFNYNQRLRLLDPAIFPRGLKMPLVVRSTEQASAIAQSGDVLFQNGEGRVLLFKDAGNTAPPGIAADPLVGNLGWAARAERFYLPEPGLFDVLVRFRDGKHARLTPGGTQFWYDVQGRLTRIADRFESNWQEMVYTAAGRLRKIIDRSIPGEARYLEIGYYLPSGDAFAEFFTGLDRRSENSKWRGLIATLRDFAGRDILFEYTPEGILQRRLGVAVTADCSEGFSGRSVTTYHTDDCGDVIGLVQGGSGPEAGSPIFAGAGEDRSRGSKTIHGGNGLYGGVNLELPTENHAGNNAEAERAATTADGARTRYTLDANGYVRHVELTGPNGLPAEWELRYDNEGRLEYIRYPEGNWVETTYDRANPVLRSRGNILEIVRHPGLRGGEVITTRHRLDSWFNLPSGEQADENGDKHVYTLSADHRVVERIAHGNDGETERRYNEYGQLIHLATPDGGIRGIFFNEQTGYPEREERGSMAVRYVYDESIAGRLGMAARIEFPIRAPIARRYDSRLLLVEESRAESLRRLCYDENGNIVRIETGVDAGTVLVQTRRYNQAGFLEEETVHDLETGAGNASLTRIYTPDALNRVKSIRHPGGQVETFSYDNHGHLTERRLGDYVENYRLDRDGNLLELQRGEETVLEQRYDGHNRLIAQIRPLGNGEPIEERFSYFGRGELRSRRLEEPVYGVAYGFETIAVDALGRTKEVRQAGTTIAPVHRSRFSVLNGLETATLSPRETRTTFHDTAGLLRTRSDSLQQVTYTYDANHQLEKTESLEDGVNFTTGYVLNDLEHLLSTRDDLGLLAAFVPRLDGRFKSVTDGRGQTTHLKFSRAGEQLELHRPSGVGFSNQFDENRQPSFAGEAAGPPFGDRYTYDASLRKNTETTRDGGERAFEEFDGRNRPRKMIFPGGAMDVSYDLQGRMARVESAYLEGRNYAAAFRYDAADRVRESRFGAALQHRMNFTYDAAGPLLDVSSAIGGETFLSKAALYEDGARRSLLYPSDARVTEARQSSGRLAAVEVNGEPLMEVREFSGSNLPRVTGFGQGLGDQPAILRENVYDPRRRLVRTRYTQPATGRVLAELRYDYDLSDNPVGRQWIHRSGRADFFRYDEDSRLAGAHYAARPAQPGDAPRVLPGVTEAANGFAPGAFGRIYSFDSGNRDLLTAAALANPDGASAYSFAQTQGGHDEFLFARTVDGEARPAPDPLGNTAESSLRVRPEASGAAGPAAIPSQMFYDAFGRLARLERSDGVAVDYEYSPDALMVRKRVTAAGGTQLISERLFVWREGRLLEEWEFAPVGRTLAARYYYAGGDHPFAADLLDNGALVRVFYLVDAQGSVIGLAGADGEILERVNYDAYGQPRIEARDERAPVVAQIRRHAEGLMIVFTEPVLPRLLAENGEGFATRTDPLGAMINVVGFQGETILAEAASGLPYAHAVFFRGTIPEGTPLAVRIAGHSLEDEWGNAVASTEISFNYRGIPGELLFDSGAVIGSTAARTRSRSVVGNPILFHGQWFDYDAGLVYLRARHYDPFTGTFLQRDPAGYADSVNPYCGFQNNPLTFRDPSGEAIFVPILIAALVGAGIDGWMQVAEWGFSGNFDAAAVKGPNIRRMVAAGVAGGIGGGVGATLASGRVTVSLGASRLAAGIEAAGTGAVERAITGEGSSVGDVARDAGLGFVIGEAGRHVGKHLKARAGRKALETAAPQTPAKTPPVQSPPPAKAAPSRPISNPLADTASSSRSVPQEWLDLAPELAEVHRRMARIRNVGELTDFMDDLKIKVVPETYSIQKYKKAMPMAGDHFDPARNINSEGLILVNRVLVEQMQQGGLIPMPRGTLPALKTLQSELFHSINARALHERLQSSSRGRLPHENHLFDEFMRHYMKEQGVGVYQRIIHYWPDL